MATKFWWVVVVVVAIVGLGVGLGACASHADERNAGDLETVPQFEPSAPVATDSPWKVSLIVDGVQGKVDADGLYYVFPEPVSTNPLVSFAMDGSLGRFQSAVITIREVIGGVVALDGIFISDFAAAEEYKLRPDRPFLLLNPGPGVIVGQGETIDIQRLKPGCTYQIDLVVQGDDGHQILPARFTTR